MPIPALELEPVVAVRDGARLPAGPIVVATDGSEESDGALRMAWALAGRTGSDVQIVSVLEPLPAASEIAALVNADDFRTEQRESQLAAVKAQIARVVPAECSWPVELIEGASASTLARHVAARRAGVLVMGRGRHRLPALLVGGETVLRALRFGETPVFAVEPGSTGLPRRIVIATDFSAYSIHAARVALAISAPDALVYLVHVRPHARFAGPASARWEHRYAAAVPALLEDVRDQLHAGSDVQIETIVLSGAAAPAVIEFAETAAADLIVSGTHGYGFINRLVLGSMARELLRESSVSLLCVPGSAVAHAAARDQKASQLQPDAVPRADWASTLDAFTRRHEGEPCTIEWVPSGGSGLHTIELGHAFVGAAYDDRDVAVTLMTGAGRFEGPHTTHFVSDVRNLEVLRREDGVIHGLRVLGRHGTTSLRLLP
jgi:nucleotide-binding universal stress UspA family protein